MNLTRNPTKNPTGKTTGNPTAYPFENLKGRPNGTIAGNPTSDPIRNAFENLTYSITYIVEPGAFPIYMWECCQSR